MELAALTGFVVTLSRWPGDPDRPVRALASAWLLAEVAILVLSGYWVYV